jgi:hypothetical protein
MTRLQALFGAIVLTQAVHSLEEYRGRLWESFPPARFVSGMVSPDPEQGFLMLNLLLVVFGLWCFLWPVLREWPSAVPLAWLWVVIEFINGVGHPIWSLRQGGYTPGVATAPLLLVLALALGRQLRPGQRDAGRRIRMIAPERWFLACFVILFLVFFLLLVIQPTSVGRGGR